MSSVSNFTGSANAFVRLLHLIPADGWDAPALDRWTVRQLAGHTARAILTVQTYLDHDEPGGVGIRTPEEYYRTVYPALFDARAIEADGVSAGAWLTRDAAAQVADAAARAASSIESQHPDRAVSIGGMGIPLDVYLCTRVVELVLHTLDLSAATGIPADLPHAAVADASALVVAMQGTLRHGEERLLQSAPSVTSAA